MEVTGIPPHSDTTVVTAGLVALAMGMLELIKTVFSWVSKRVNKKEADHVVVQLDHEVAHSIKETSKNVQDVLGIISRVDLDGTPMVYSSRTGFEHLRAVVEVIRDIQKSQERLASALDKLDARFAQHDRDEQITHRQMQDTLEIMREIKDGK